MDSKKRLGFSVDVEDWRPLSGVAARIDSGIHEQLERLLQLLDAASARGTFFTVAELARREPALIRWLADQGHEVACHGLYHVDMARLGHDEFASHVKDGKHIIEDVVGAAIVGFRAPFFRLPKPASDARSILKDAGYAYDSSACGGSPRSDVIPLFAASTLPRFGRALPLGSGFLAAFSRPALTRSIESEVRKTGRAIFYMHPYNMGAKRLNCRNIVGPQFMPYLRHHVAQTAISSIFRRNLKHVLGLGQWVPIRDMSVD